MIADLLQLCINNDWPEVRKYLSSDAAEEEKKSNIMYRDHNGRTCLHKAYYDRAPVNIMKAMLDFGGKELVMKIHYNSGTTALHSACITGASYNIIKMLIEVGGKDLVMAEDKAGDTALHDLCLYMNRHTKVAAKIKLILQVGDANLLLSAKSSWGNTPLEIATDNGASNIQIKNLLTLQSTNNPTRSNNTPSTNIVPADNGTPIPQSNQEQDTTRSSSTNNDPNIPIRGLGIEQNYQSQLREAEEKAKTIQQDFDQKCI
jgi:ankyrin repeat protein